MKICATTLGETAGDLFSMTLKAGYAVTTLVLSSLLLIVLFFQLISKEYKPLLFWSVILLTSTAGTTMSDYMDRTLELGYLNGSLILVALLVTTLAAWKANTGSLSVASIDNGKSEIFYWTAILFSNTLGTALGDFLSDSSGLGFQGGAFLIGSLLIIISLTYFFSRVSRVFLFWTAFILTRPYGAEIGDLLTKPEDKGGLNLGTLNSSLVLLAILGFYIFLAVMKQHKKIPLAVDDDFS